MNKLQSDYEKEILCDYLFKTNGPFWHLCTPGIYTCDFLRDELDFEVAMNIVAIVAAIVPGIKIITFELMRNHIHFIIAGSKENVIKFFDLFKEKLSKHYIRNNRYQEIKGISMNDPIYLESLKALRNEIVYVNRNGYVVNPQTTPFSYEWGCNTYFFNTLTKSIKEIHYNGLTRDQKRKILHSRALILPDSYTIIGNIINPMSYCAIEEGESYFKDAHQYFNLLSRAYEAYSETANRMGDQIVLTADELYSAAVDLAKQTGNISNPRNLCGEDKIEVAKILKTKYHANNNSLRRILNIDDSTLSELFPQL